MAAALPRMLLQAAGILQRASSAALAVASELVLRCKPVSLEVKHRAPLSIVPLQHPMARWTHQQLMPMLRQFLKLALRLIRAEKHKAGAPNHTVGCASSVCRVRQYGYLLVAADFCTWQEAAEDDACSSADSVLSVRALHSACCSCAKHSAQTGPF